MNRRTNSHLTLGFLSAVIFLVFISCNLPGRSANPRTASSTTEMPVADQSASALPLAAEQGLTRSNPFPRSQVVSISDWKIQVLEMQRGAAAWQLMQTGGDTISPPPAGQEYLTIKVSVQCTKIDDRTHSFGLSEMFVTGDRLQAYKDLVWDFPAPEFYHSDFYTAEKIDGWIDTLVPVGEHNLILVFAPTGSEGADIARYIALEDGASVPIPAELAGIAPNDLGQDLAHPVPFNQVAISDDWEIQILETLRGEAAWQALLNIKPDFEPPETGMEYLLSRIRLRYISTDEGRVMIFSTNFRSARSMGEEYPSPHAVLLPDSQYERFDDDFFPGLQVEAWALAQMAVGETGAMIVFDPDINAYGSQDINLRYLTAEP